MKTRTHPGDLAAAIAAQCDAWAENDLAQRIWQRDWSVWSDCLPPELADRLGWLDLPYGEHAAAAQALAAAVIDPGVDRVVLVGMGGSSLAPEVFAATLPGIRPLTVADSTHPDSVAALLAAYDPVRTLVLVSSKSGTTAETQALAGALAERAQTAGIEPTQRFVAITDPGSPLAEQAVGWRALVTAPADVGGRFAALGPFGLVPAACCGIDVAAPVAAARRAADAAQQPRSAALELGAWLAAAHAAGRTNLCLVGDSATRPLAAWIEQLVAESLGKDGMGLVPIRDGDTLGAATRGRDAVWVATLGSNSDPAACHEAMVAGVPVLVRRVAHPTDIAAEMFTWQFAVAAAGAALAVHPFNQPDVEAAKRHARTALTNAATRGAADPLPPPRLRTLAALLGPGDTIAVTAFLRADPAIAHALVDLRSTLAARLGRPVTVDFGPRFLHATGQLHKGGANNLVVLQLLDHPRTDVPIAGRSYSFAALLRAQADGDAAALAECGRRLIRVDLGDAPATSLRAWSAALRDS